MGQPTYEDLQARVAELEARLADLRSETKRPHGTFVVRQLPGAVWMVDEDLRFTLSEGGGLRYLGLEPGQVVGATLFEFFQTDESGTVIIRHREALAGASGQFRMAFGGRVYDAHVEPYREADGRISAAIGVAFDVTERVRAEEASLRNEARLTAIFESSPYAIVTTDLAAVVTGANRAALALFDYDALDEFVGSSPIELVVPEERARAVRDLERTVASGRVDDAQYTLLTRTGERVDAEISAAVVRDPSGRASSLVVIVRDIRERKRALEDLALRELAIASAREGIAFASFDMRLTYVNDAFLRLWGYERPEEVVGRSPLEFWSDREAAQRVVEAISSEGHWSGGLVGLRRDGAPLDLYVRSSLARDEQGQPLAMMASFEDVAERRNAEERQRRLEAQLQQAQKMETVGRLAGGVAHDFNNLLTVIMGTAELALLRLAPGQAFFDELDEIRSTAARSAELTSQLLAFSRQQVAEPKVVDPNVIVDGSRRMLRRLISEDIRLSIRPAPELWPVKADPGQLEQVLTNLVLNARDAMPMGGELTIETGNVTLDAEALAGEPDARPGDYVRLTVRDTGAGMDEETRRRVFEPFFTTKDRGKGTGLGLATCYGIVKQNEGYVRVSSEVERGTAFEVFLPRNDGAVSAGAARADAPAPGNESVLVVEDEPDVRSIVCRILEAHGYDVVSAAGGAEALELAERLGGGLDLLLTDVVMPEMGGRALAEQLQARLPEIRVLFMSGYTADSIGRHGVLEPGIALIQKPFTQSQLLRKVREILEPGRR